MLIDYLKLAKAMEAYEALGFKRVEAPWWVPPEILKLTAPQGIEPEKEYSIVKNGKNLVASGEQSFLYMINQGLLPPGKYQATTPCFRSEIQGLLRRKYFMKTELIITDEVTEAKLWEVINQCMTVFATLVPRPSLLEIVSVDDTYDIEYGGIEIGSYGIRAMPFTKWIYATGIAEPRLSRAIAIAETRKIERI